MSETTSFEHDDNLSKEKQSHETTQQFQVFF